MGSGHSTFETIAEAITPYGLYKSITGGGFNEKPASAPTPSQPPSAPYSEGLAGIGQILSGKRGPSAPSSEQPPMKIPKTFTPQDPELSTPFSDPVLQVLNQPFPSSQNTSTSIQSLYSGLQSLGSNDLFNTPATTKTSLFQLAKIENTLSPDYVSSAEFEQFQSNLQFLTDRSLISSHEVNELMQALQQSNDPVEDFLQEEKIQNVSRQIAQQPALIQQVAMDHHSILQLLHEPLNPSTMAVLISGMVEHSHIDDSRKSVAMSALKQEAVQNPILKQALNQLQSSYTQTGNQRPSQTGGKQRPSYTGEKLPPQNESGGKGVQQSTTHLLESGATNIMEGYGSYKTGGSLASAAQKAQGYIQGEGAVSELIGSEAAQGLSTGLAEVAPVLEGLGEVGAVVAVASGVNDLLTAIGVTHENYVNEAINYVENTVEDAFDNVYHKAKDFFASIFS
jgi:hypothetical protein